MPNFFRGIRRSRSIGVDLGSSSIKIAEISRKKISLAALMEIPPAERVEEAALISRLKGFFQEIGISDRESVIYIPGSYSFIRTIYFPAMPDSELKEAIRWEIKRQLPYSEEDAIFDYISQEVPEGIAATFAAVEIKNVRKYVSVFKEAGLKVIAVDVSPLALIRALDPKDTNNILLIDIGAKHLEVDIIRLGVLRLTRTVEMGGELIINYLIGEGVSLEDANKILMNASSDEMKEPLNQILREITRSINYYKANFKEKVFTSVILTGGLSLNSHINDYFSKSLDMPVSVPNPFEGFTLADESIRMLGPRFSVAMGLARRSD